MPENIKEKIAEFMQKFYNELMLNNVNEIELKSIIRIEEGRSAVATVIKKVIRQLTNDLNTLANINIFEFIMPDDKLILMNIEKKIVTTTKSIIKCMNLVFDYMISTQIYMDLSLNKVPISFAFRKLMSEIIEMENALFNSEIPIPTFLVRINKLLTDLDEITDNLLHPEAINVAIFFSIVGMKDKKKSGTTKKELEDAVAKALVLSIIKENQPIKAKEILTKMKDKGKSISPAKLKNILEELMSEGKITGDSKKGYITV